MYFNLIFKLPFINSHRRLFRYPFHKHSQVTSVWKKISFEKTDQAWHRTDPIQYGTLLGKGVKSREARLRGLLSLQLQLTFNLKVTFNLKESQEMERGGWFLQKNVSCSERTWWPTSSTGHWGRLLLSQWSSRLHQWGTEPHRLAQAKTLLSTSLQLASSDL